MRCKIFEFRSKISKIKMKNKSKPKHRIKKKEAIVTLHKSLAAARRENRGSRKLPAYLLSRCDLATSHIVAMKEELELPQLHTLDLR